VALRLLLLEFPDRDVTEVSPRTLRVKPAAIPADRNAYGDLEDPALNRACGFRIDGT
jgi:hypothetical protein